MELLIGAALGAAGMWAMQKYVMPKVKAKIAEWVK